MWRNNMKNHRHPFIEKLNMAIEYFVEKYNGIIQAGVLLVVLAITTAIGLCNDPNKKLDMLISLIAGLMIEIILLHIKDSSSQRKMNSIGEILRRFIKTSEFWNYETDLAPFFEKAKKEFFISGLIIDKLLTGKNYEKIIDLLKRGVKVTILLESPDNLKAAAKFFYGNDYNEDFFNILKERIKGSITYICSIPEVEKYINDGKLEIRISNVSFVNPSIVAYDYKDVFEKRTKFDTAPEMSVRMYVPGIDGPSSKLKHHPTMLVNSNTMAREYDDFVNVLNNEYADSTIINNVDDLKKKYDLTK